MNLKLRLYAAAVVSVLTYACEAWPLSVKIVKWLSAWNARRLAFVTGREIRDEYVVPSFDLVARIRARRLTWAGHLLRAKEEYLPRRMALAQLQSDMERHTCLGTTTDLFQDAPERKSIPEMVVLARDRAGWRRLVEYIEPEDTLAIQRRKKDRSRRNRGTSAMDLDAATWLKGVNKEGKFIQ